MDTHPIALLNRQREVRVAIERLGNTAQRTLQTEVRQLLTEREPDQPWRRPKVDLHLVKRVLALELSAYAEEMVQHVHNVVAPFGAWLSTTICVVLPWHVDPL